MALTDGYGHDDGDIALKTLARVLKDTCWQSDTLARFGGDEFALILPNADEHDTKELCARIHKSVRELVSVSPMTISIGISSRTVDVPIDYPAALKRADQALYAAKQAGRNTTAVWGQSVWDLVAG